MIYEFRVKNNIRRFLIRYTLEHKKQCTHDILIFEYTIMYGEKNILIDLVINISFYMYIICIMYVLPRDKSRDKQNFMIFYYHLVSVGHRCGIRKDYYK